MRRIELDTTNFNLLLQAEFNPDSIGLKMAGVDKHVVYDSSELDELVLAYAVLWGHIPAEDDRDFYTAKNIFFVPENSRWDVIASAAHTPEIGQEGATQ